MDDVQQLNEAYSNIDYARIEQNDLRGNDAIEGWKVFSKDNGVSPTHPAYRQIRHAYIEGFFDAKNIFHEVEDDWETRY